MHYSCFKFLNFEICENKVVFNAYLKFPKKFLTAKADKITHFFFFPCIQVLESAAYGASCTHIRLTEHKCHHDCCPLQCQNNRVAR